jgi:2'-5' RNA ligase
MSGCNGEGAGINSFALVCYLPQPLAGFLDDLRKRLVSECQSRAHLTILPPRPLECQTEQVWAEVRGGLTHFQPFRIELGRIEIFPITNVIYLSVVQGADELRRLHDRLNAGGLAFEEPFEYHPHVTLAQDLAPEDVPAVAELAAEFWRDFTGPRSFDLQRLTFVQNTLVNRWNDLRAFGLADRVRI